MSEDIDREIYMKQPWGSNLRNFQIMFVDLRKAICGFPQSADASLFINNESSEHGICL